MISGREIFGSSDVAANRPSAADVPDDYVFLATDTGTYSVQSGGAWFDITGGGGGGGSTAREQLVDTPGTSLANGATSVISIGAKTVGTDLLDLTDAVHPLIVTTGVYVVTVTVYPQDTMTAGGNFDLFLILDVDGEAATAASTASPATALETVPFTTASAGYYLPAGAEIDIEVTNNDGVSAITFQPSTVIQRIS